MRKTKKEHDETEPDALTDTAITSIDGFQKRHIGAMARSGWMPFRPTLNRRFSRSDRTGSLERIVMKQKNN